MRRSNKEVEIANQIKGHSAATSTKASESESDEDSTSLLYTNIMERSSEEDDLYDNHQFNASHIEEGAPEAPIEPESKNKIECIAEDLGPTAMTATTIEMESVVNNGFSLSHEVANILNSVCNINEEKPLEEKSENMQPLANEDKLEPILCMIPEIPENTGEHDFHSHLGAIESLSVERDPPNKQQIGEIRDHQTDHPMPAYDKKDLFKSNQIEEEPTEKTQCTEDNLSEIENQIKDHLAAISTNTSESESAEDSTSQMFRNTLERSSEEDDLYDNHQFNALHIEEGAPEASPFETESKDRTQCIAEYLSTSELAQATSSMQSETNLWETYNSFQLQGSFGFVPNNSPYEETVELDEISELPVIDKEPKEESKMKKNILRSGERDQRDPRIVEVCDMEANSKKSKEEAQQEVDEKCDLINNHWFFSNHWSSSQLDEPSKKLSTFERKQVMDEMSNQVAKTSHMIRFLGDQETSGDAPDPADKFTAQFDQHQHIDDVINIELMQVASSMNVQSPGQFTHRPAMFLVRQPDYTPRPNKTASTQTDLFRTQTEDNRRQNLSFWLLLLGLMLLISFGYFFYMGTHHEEEPKGYLEELFDFFK